MGTGSEIGPYEEKSMFREVDAEYEDLSTLSVVGSAVFDGQEARSPSCLPSACAATDVNASWLN